MSPLVFDKQGKPFAWHSRTRKLKVPLFRNPAARGTHYANLVAVAAIRTDLYRPREQHVRAGDVIGYVGAPAPDAFKRIHFELWERDRSRCLVPVDHTSPAGSSSSTTMRSRAPRRSRAGRPRSHGGH